MSGQRSLSLRLRVGLLFTSADFIGGGFSFCQIKYNRQIRSGNYHLCSGIITKKYVESDYTNAMTQHYQQYETNWIVLNNSKIRVSVSDDIYNRYEEGDQFVIILVGRTLAGFIDIK